MKEIILFLLFVIFLPVIRPRQFFFGIGSLICWLLSRPVNWYIHFAVNHWYWPRSLESWIHWHIALPSRIFLENISDRLYQIATK